MSENGIPLATIFGITMGVGAMVALIAIASYLVRLCIKRELWSFHSGLITSFLLCDVGAIVGAFLRYGTSPTLSNGFPVLCQTGEVVFIFFNTASPIFAFGLCLSFLTLVFYSSIPVFDQLSSKLSYQFLFHLILWALAAIFTAVPIIIEGLPGNPCQTTRGSAMTVQGVWLVCTGFNLVICGFIYYKLQHNATEASQASSKRASLRIVLNIALFVGVLRIPSFAISIIFGGNLNFEQLSLGMFSAVALSFLLLLLQPAMIVLMIFFNQGVFSCSNSPPAAPSSFSKDKRRSEKSALELAAEDLI